MIDWNRPLDIRTRDGNKVVIYCINAEGPHPVHGRILIDNKNSVLTAWYSDGDCVAGDDGSMDLVQEPRKHRVFVIIGRAKKDDHLITGSYLPDANIEYIERCFEDDGYEVVSRRYVTMTEGLRLDDDEDECADSGELENDE